jgi:hypothetical protein
MILSRATGQAEPWRLDREFGSLEKTLGTESDSTSYEDVSGGNFRQGFIFLLCFDLWNGYCNESRQRDDETTGGANS